MSERVLLIGCQTQKDSDEAFQTSLNELEALAYTVNAEIVEVFTQKREKIHNALYIGTGKVEEIKEFIEEHEVDLAIMNGELSPSQIRNLNQKWDVAVIDRTQLILDIFAMRANTKEGKLQVELAQLEYLLPRLHGQGRALSRLGGGIGTRGPGETKLETDRRHIQNRITDIKKQLKQVVKQRSQYRERRKKNAAFQISIVGYTNAGKSTLFNRLSNSVSLEENKLFATLDPMTRRIFLSSGFQALISDTVGFIQDLPTTLVAAFRSTLEEVLEADLILHVVDASNEQAIEQEKTVYSILNELGADSIPILTVYNKSDLLSDEFTPYSKPSVVISALDEDDLERLIKRIEETLIEEWSRYSIAVPKDEGNLLHRLNRETIVEEEEFVENEEYYFVRGYADMESPIYNEMKKRANENE